MNIHPYELDDYAMIAYLERAMSKCDRVRFNIVRQINYHRHSIVYLHHSVHEERALTQRFGFLE